MLSQFFSKGRVSRGNLQATRISKKRIYLHLSDHIHVLFLGIVRHVRKISYVPPEGPVACTAVGCLKNVYYFSFSGSRGLLVTCIFFSILISLFHKNNIETNVQYGNQLNCTDTIHKIINFTKGGSFTNPHFPP